MTEKQPSDPWQHHVTSMNDLQYSNLILKNKETTPKGRNLNFGHHICFIAYIVRTYTIYYYSTNCNTIQIWSRCSRYLSSIGNRYPAIYVASYVLNVTTVPFEIQFARPFLLQGFTCRLFCYQFVE